MHTAHCARFARLSIYVPSYMASAWRRHPSARLAFWAFNVGASHSAADRSKCAAASLSSAADRGPSSQAQALPNPRSTNARMVTAVESFGAALTTLADSALSPSSHDPLGASTPLRVSIHLPGVRKTRTQEGAVCTKGGEAKETFTQGKFM